MPGRGGDRRSRSLAALVAAGLLGLLGPTVGTASGRAAPPAVAGGPLTLLAPGSARAGEPVTLTVRGLGPTGGTLLAIGSLGSQAVEVRPASDGADAARVVLPTVLTRASGRLELVLRDGDRVATASTYLVPGPVVDPVVTVVGARSIVANGEDPAMAVAVPVDRWGNSVAEGTPVTVPHRRPDGTVDVLPAQVRHLLTWVEVVAGTAAGTGALWTVVDGSTGTETSLDEVPGPPGQVVLSLDRGPTARPADGRSLVALRTGLLTDRNGNVELDGTAVQLQWRGPEGTGTATAVTVAGVARFEIQAPSLPGTVVLSASSRGTRSAPLAVPFVAAVDTVPASATRDGDVLTVAVGPVLLAEGATVSDGTPVEVVVRTSDGRVVTTAQLLGGRADVAVPVAADTDLGAVRVGVLGAVTRVGSP